MTKFVTNERVQAVVDGIALAYEGLTDNVIFDENGFPFVELDVLEEIVGHLRSALSTCDHGLSSLTCKKVQHDLKKKGYLHSENDDGPYDVDGVVYCGRCHCPLPH